jgi:ATP-binding cassette subfamily C protein
VGTEILRDPDGTSHRLLGHITLGCFNGELEAVKNQRQPSSVGRQLGERSAHDAAGVHGPSLVLSLLTLVLVTAAQGALNLLQLRLAVAINHDVVAGLRRQLFDRMCRADWARYTGFRMSDLLEALTAQADRVGYAARSVLVLGSSVVTVAVYVAIAAAVSTSMTAVSVLTGGLLMALLGRPRRASAQAGEEQAMLSKRLYASASDTLLSMKTIRAHGAERRHALELIAIGERERELGLRLAGAHGAGRLGFDVAAVGLLGLVTFLGLRAFAVPPAELLLILFVFVRLAPQLSSLQQACQNVAADLPAFESLMATLQSCEAAAEPRADDEPVSFNHHIRVDHAGFAYGDAPVLTDVTLAIPAGSTVAIVGPSGAGKSTLADLVLGLVTPQSGRVMVDGVPLTPGRMSAWRAQVGYVPQDTSLVHDTVRANLLCAAPHARPEEIWAALKTAAAAGFVGDLPRGLETVVGDRGVLLSGGERQRLGLARALLRRPRLLILDEATSSLDSENERVIEQAVSSLHGRVAILLITHRLSAVQRALFCRIAGSCRFVYNKALTLQRARTTDAHRRLSYVASCLELVRWKSDPECVWLNDCPSQALQQSLKDLDRAFCNFAAGRTGAPRFKKRGRHDTICSMKAIARCLASRLHTRSRVCE